MDNNIVTQITHNKATATHSPPHDTLPFRLPTCTLRAPLPRPPIVPTCAPVAPRPSFQPARRLHPGLASLPTSAIYLEHVDVEK